MISKENILFGLIILTLVYLVYRVYSINNEVAELKKENNKNLSFQKIIQELEKRQGILLTQLNNLNNKIDLFPKNK